MHCVDGGNQPRLKAFTLLEMAVVLAIIGIIIGGGIAILASSTAAVQYNNTSARIDYINDALLGYSQAFGRLPCPADLTLPPTDVNYGVEAAGNNSSCRGGTPSANFSVSYSTVEGGIPVRTLRIPDSYMYDAWGRRLRYAVNPSYTNVHNVSGGSGVALCGIKDGDITVNDATGAARTTSATYVILSHGQSGHGGFTRNGIMVNKGVTNTDKLTNCHCDSSAAPTAYTASYVQKLPTVSSSSLTDIFDDIVSFREASQLKSSSMPAVQCIAFQGKAATADNTAFIDDVHLDLANSIANPGFEVPYVGYTNYQYNPAGASWVFAGSSGITANASPFTGSQTAPEGVQVAFLQGLGSFSQTIAPGAGSYTVSFYAANRSQWSGPEQDFSVSVDGAVVGSFSVTSAPYTLFTTPSFTLTAGTHTLTFTGLNTADPGGDNTAFIDMVTLSGPSLTVYSDLGNNSFETSLITSGSYQYNPVGTPWNFSAGYTTAQVGAGYVSNGSGFSNPDALKGTQAAFIQNTGGISQAFAVPSGNYRIRFNANNRYYGTQIVDVIVNGVVVGEFTPSAATYQGFATSNFYLP